MKNNIEWPDGKDFVFTVFDDTDLSTIENVREVYSLLSNFGFYTTKSVWPVRSSRLPDIAGSTCEDKDYLQWLLSLKNQGFEMAFHNATYHSSFRSETISGLKKFKEYFGHYPISMSNHAGNLESIYWGSSRLTGINRWAYNLLTLNRHNGFFRGHVEGDEYFWGDICKENILYVRNFVYSDINTFKVCPVMPYHDANKPYVNYWFASSEGSDVKAFNKVISEENQDRLEAENGACIMYTHFSKEFYDHKTINKRFKDLMKRLSRKNGWFVPVSTLLNYLIQQKGHNEVTDEERNYLERRWLFHKISVGYT